MLVWIILAITVAGLGYIRLAPADAQRFHLHLAGDADETRAGSALRVRDGGAAEFTRLVDTIVALDRTHTIAGSLESGHMTFVTRSLFFGFPDYTTIEILDGQIRLFARLRFGSADLGVNARRLDEVISRAGL